MSLAIPLLLLYEGSIWSVRFVENQARAQQSSTTPDAKPAE
jgi:sec-independent protein translocase protein TatC